MATQATTITKLFQAETSNGIPVFSSGKTQVQYADLEPPEAFAVKLCYESGIEQLGEISPKLKAYLMRQEPAMEKWAGIAKAHFPTVKPITFPSEPGTLGVNFLIPESIRYNHAQSSTYPDYTDYTENSWDISLTAGTEAWLFGDGTNFYKASPTDQQHSMLVLAAGGVLELGSTPKYDQFRITSEILSKYGIVTEQPLNDQPLEADKTIYRHASMGMTPIYHDLGFMWGIMPRFTGISTIKLVGLMFYEHDLYSDVVYTV